MAEKHGSINWTELWTSDGKAAQDFYAKLYGWTYEPMPGAEGSYMLAKSGDFLYIPAGVAHLPYNPSATETCTAVIARTDPNEQESVVLLPELEKLR